MDLAGDFPELSRATTAFSRVFTVDDFDPPQRERIREEVARLTAEGLRQKAIAAAIKERPTVTAVQRALALERLRLERGLDSPYEILLEPPADYTKLRRHLHPKYNFEPLPDYERPKLEE